jgi:archaellin
MKGIPKFLSVYYRYVRLCISLCAVLWIFLLFSCKKERVTVPPNLAFISDSGFVTHDTTLSVGQTIWVGIEAGGNGINLTYFHIGWNNGQQQTLLDSGMNQPELTYHTSITKTASDSEIWIFQVMDRERNFNAITLTLHWDSTSNYGPIHTANNLLLGAQSNPVAGSFYSIEAVHRYFLDEAYMHQDSIDLIYYFDLYDATLSSPAESDAPTVFTGPTGLANWTIKNETRYDTTAFNSADFDLSANDSLILAAYEPVNLKRKAKYILPGMVISFQDPHGKLGLIHVKEVVPGATGQVLIDIKIQQ